MNATLDTTIDASADPMELDHSPMSQRQRDYRAIYRARIATWYNGYIHIAVIYAIGAMAMYIYITNIAAVAWWEWLTIPAVFLFCNFFEWFLHRHIMHRPQKNPGLRAIYTRHTLMHHQFFTHDEVRFAGQHDWRVTVFPPYALCVFILMTMPGAIVLGWLISPNVGWLMMCTTTSLYLIYEFMHFCCHVDDNAFVRNTPLINTIRRHHAAHHDMGIMMDTNMNLTFPISDWLFGTSDLNRGLLGTLFNGYDQRHVRTDLKKTRHGNT